MSRRPRRRESVQPKSAPLLDGAAIISQVLEKTRASVSEKQRQAQTKGKTNFKFSISFAIDFAKYIGKCIEDGFRPRFPTVTSGEVPSDAAGGRKRVDIKYSTPEAGLGWLISLKSVHFGERKDKSPDAGFIHNMKRNDEELRVEATGHHLRQPYSVLVALLFLPAESFTDLTPTSSFASWAQYLWPLKGRTLPEDPPDLYELVFIGVYARDGSGLWFYEVGGTVKCPRQGRPESLLSFLDFLQIVTKAYDKRNRKDFSFAGEEPAE
jgi:hypothetical protein